MFYCNPEYELEGWRVVGANDTLPPNLQKLWLTDCTSATPLLLLTQLTALTIAEHCHMPAAELERLSAMTHLQAVRLGYNVYRGGFVDREAQENSAGWGHVLVLRELELHRMWIDSSCDLLKHLAGLTALTRLV
jgi:hypothetical protein